MSNAHNRDTLIQLLHELDAQLTVPVTIEICGSSSAIIGRYRDRTTTDIDIMRSTLPGTDPRLKKAVEEVAKHHHLPIDPPWLHDIHVDMYSRFPSDYKPETSTIIGEKFSHLQPRIISKADFVLTKFAWHENIRPRDIIDVKNVQLSDSDLTKIYQRFDFVALSRPYDALSIEGHFKEIRPEQVKSNAGYRYTNEKEISKYFEHRYGTSATAEQRSIWQERLSQSTANAGSIIAGLDLAAAKRIHSGDSALQTADKKYRIAREKEIDHGVDL